MLFDKKVLLSQFDNDMDILKAVVNEFEKCYLKMLKKIENSIEAKDSEILGTSAHTYKGSVSNFMAPEVVEVAFNLEKIGKSGSTEGAMEIYNDLSQKTEVLIVELKEIL